MSRPATDRLKLNPPLGMLPALQYLLPAQLKIDASYQRSLDTDAGKALVRRIAQHWNWDLCQPLVVSRRADGALYVIDGQHRLAAARLRGDIAQLPAVVVQYASAADEAASFVHLNQERTPLTRLDLFKAALASGDSEALAIVEALDAAGLMVAPHNNFTATLEERASCPATCREWASCYGNRMQAAERIEHGPALMPALAREIAGLAARHPGGFLVRLHVLGDFWSVDYVAFWEEQLTRTPALHLFGFTAHDPASPIGSAIAGMTARLGWERAAIRFSGAAGRDDASRVLGPGEHDGEAILCPAQTGATDCCATCALCWQSRRSIAFRRH